MEHPSMHLFAHKAIIAFYLFGSPAKGASWPAVHTQQQVGCTLLQCIAGKQFVEYTYEEQPRHLHTHTHTWTLSLGGVASCILRSVGVLGLAPRHFTCKSTGRNTCRYAGLIRPSISRGIALFVGQPAMLTGLPPCASLQFETLCYQRCTHTRTPFSGVVYSNSQGTLLVGGEYVHVASV